MLGPPVDTAKRTQRRALHGLPPGPDYWVNMPATYTLLGPNIDYRLWFVRR